jgi:hypothetical protein
MRLASTEPADTPYFNLSQHHFVCECGETASKTVPDHD